MDLNDRTFAFDVAFVGRRHDFSHLELKSATDDGVEFHVVDSPTLNSITMDFETIERIHDFLGAHIAGVRADRQRRKEPPQ